MMPSHAAAPKPTTRTGEAEPDTLDALVSSSRDLGRFWPAKPARPAASGRPMGVKVPSDAQRLVAGMPEYGS